MITEIVSSILNSTETAFFVLLIIGVTFYLGHIKYTRFSIAHGPEILTTLGIAGCFLGIALGLLNFDSNNVQLSIPSLLSGVKTAFWSSIAGVFGALYIKYRHYTKKLPASVNEEENKAASIEDIVSVMTSLKNGLVGDEQGTLLSQMKLQRQESGDKMDSLIAEFKNFAAHMVENNQKAIIEALKEVIKDFNEQLTEQFGENFKNLNAAVEKLVVWQQQYKEELDLIQKSQKQTSEDLSSVANNFKMLVQEAEKFTEISNSLHKQLELMEVQKETLYEQQKSFAEVLATMKDVTPEFSSKVDAMLKEINSGLANIQSEIASSVKNFGVQLQSSNAEMKTLLTDTIKKSQEDVSSSLKDQVATIKEGVITLDKVMQKELNDAIESMGRQLASLSTKFVDDYGPLTDRLREVVQLSRKI
jgi:uncharacterized membrane protein YjfL (UPF0719 family)/ABC-type transporter Mla subunit MlaD